METQQHMDVPSCFDGEQKYLKLTCRFRYVVCLAPLHITVRFWTSEWVEFFFANIPKNKV